MQRGPKVKMMRVMRQAGGKVLAPENLHQLHFFHEGVFAFSLQYTPDGQGFEIKTTGIIQQETPKSIEAEVQNPHSLVFKVVDE